VIPLPVIERKGGWLWDREEERMGEREREREREEREREKECAISVDVLPVIKKERAMCHGMILQ